MRLIHGDCLQVLRDLPADSIDAIVTDPPYGLGFMGKAWDAPGLDWAHEWAAECLRVLKPGGHLVAFGATRTLHRLTVAVEDAGFDIRDVVHWAYWTGFPKSLDVSKAIDRRDAANEQQARRYRFTAWVRSTGLTSRQIDEATGTCMGNHYTTHPTQPAIMTREHLDAVRHLIDDVPAWVEAEVDRRTVESQNMKARQVLGINSKAADSWAGEYVGTTKPPPVDVPITAPATPEAHQWHGWGTALKPAVEPAVLARKPLIGTVAENVLRYGTGALNVDGCRYAVGDDAWPGPQDATTATGRGITAWMASGTPAPEELSRWDAHTLGRWPANLYQCPKASRSEREAGCEGLAARTGAEATHRAEGSDGLQSPRAGAGRTAGHVRNHHPTVKPIRLMRWLCRLVTPPGGLVLDTFMGSGTTGIAAAAEGFRFIGIERERAYVRIAAARIQHHHVGPIECPEWAVPPPPDQARLF